MINPISRVSSASVARQRDEKGPLAGLIFWPFKVSAWKMEMRQKGKKTWNFTSDTLTTRDGDRVKTHPAEGTS